MAGVAVARIDTRTGQVLEGPLPMWSGTGLRDPEAPHLYVTEGRAAFDWFVCAPMS